jgi:hypothetical protein
MLEFYEGFSMKIRVRFHLSIPSEFLIFLDIKPDGSISNMNGKESGVRIQPPSLAHPWWAETMASQGRQNKRIHTSLNTLIHSTIGKITIALHH